MSAWDSLAAPRRWARSAFLVGGLAFLALCGIYFLQRDALKYATFTQEVYQRFWPYKFSMAAHVLSASVALLVAPLQFIGAIRKRWPRFHRMIGWAYVIGALVSGPLVIRLSLLTGCLACQPPFVVWSIVWLVVTALAIAMAVQRRFEAHRQFMVRSYVLMLGFVFIRLDTHLEYPLPIGPGIERAPMVIWVSWVIPYVLTEMWLSWAPLVSRGAARKSRESRLAADLPRRTDADAA